jgi:integrase
MMQAELDEEAERERQGLKKAETLTDFSKRWLEYLATTGRARAHTLTNRVHYLNRFILPHLGHLDVRRLRRSHLSSWMATVAEMRQTDGKQAGKPYRRQTLASAWAVLRAMLRRAVVMCDLSKDPTDKMLFDLGERVGAETRPSRRVKETLTAPELRRLIEAAQFESPDIRTMMVVGFATGLRWAELSALEWRDIRLDDAMLRIERSQVAGVAGTPKTESTRRDVYLAPDVVEALREHRRWQVEQQVAGLKTGRVFPAANGKNRYPAILVEPLARCCTLAKIPKRLTAHSMRKTANNLLRQVAGDVVARAMIGHATEEMTHLYSNVDADERARAHQAAFGQAFSGVVGLGGGVAPTPPARPTGRKKKTPP